LRGYVDNIRDIRVIDLSLLDMVRLESRESNSRESADAGEELHCCCGCVVGCEVSLVVILTNRRVVACQASGLTRVSSLRERRCSGERRCSEKTGEQRGEIGEERRLNVDVLPRAKFKGKRLIVVFADLEPW